VSGRDSPINRKGSGPWVQLFPDSPCCRGRNSEQALPVVGQLGGRLYLSPQGLRGNKAREIKRLFPREHVVHGARQLMREHGEGFALAMFAFQFSKVFFP
jgi:hypothetical protein